MSPDGGGADRLAALVAEARACRVCARQMRHVPRPVLRAVAGAPLRIVGQAPGTRVQASGIPFDDPSGDRLRDWMGIDRTVFYDETRVAIVPMGFCFPGQDERGGDLPPRRECAPLWQARLQAALPAVELTLLVGQYAQRFHLGSRRRANLTDTVRAFRDYLPDILPLPHPSWRNNAWLKRNPWFADDLLPALRARVAALLGTGASARKERL